MNLLLEGDDLEALLLRAHQEGGTSARIVRAQKVRRGGVLGFFAREGFEVAVEIPPVEVQPVEVQPVEAKPVEALGTAHPLMQLPDLSRLAALAERASADERRTALAGTGAALPEALPADLPEVLPAYVPADLPAALPVVLPVALPEAPPVALPVAVRDPVPTAPHHITAGGIHPSLASALNKETLMADLPWVTELSDATLSHPTLPTPERDEARTVPEPRTAVSPASTPDPVTPAPNRPQFTALIDQLREGVRLGRHRSEGSRHSTDHPAITAALGGMGDPSAISVDHAGNDAGPALGAFPELSDLGVDTPGDPGVPRATTIVPPRKTWLGGPKSLPNPRHSVDPEPAPAPAPSLADDVMVELETPEVTGTATGEVTGSPAPPQPLRRRRNARSRPSPTLARTPAASDETTDQMTDDGASQAVRTSADAAWRLLRGWRPELRRRAPVRPEETGTFGQDVSNGEPATSPDPVQLWPANGDEPARTGDPDSAGRPAPVAEQAIPDDVVQVAQPAPARKHAFPADTAFQAPWLDDATWFAAKPAAAAVSTPAPAVHQSTETPSYETSYETRYETSYETSYETPSFDAPSFDAPSFDASYEPASVETTSEPALDEPQWTFSLDEAPALANAHASSFIDAATSGAVPAAARVIETFDRLAADREALRSFGVPAAWTRLLQEGDRFSSIVAMLAALPEQDIDPEVNVLAVVGPADVVELEAHRTALDLATGGRPRTVAVIPTGAERRSVIAKTRRTRPIVVSIAVDGYQDPATTRDLLSAVQAQAVIVVVDACRPMAEITEWIQGLERVDAIALDGALDLASPAAALSLGIPVIRIDGISVDRIGWAALLCAQLSALDASR